jgi:hypothetical protein
LAAEGIEYWMAEPAEEISFIVIKFFCGRTDEGMVMKFQVFDQPLRP